MPVPWILWDIFLEDLPDFQNHQFFYSGYPEKRAKKPKASWIGKLRPPPRSHPATQRNWFGEMASAITWGPCSIEFSDLLVHWWLSHKNLAEGRILPYLTTWAAKWGIKSKPSSFDMFGPVRPIKKSSRQCHRLPCPPTSWSTQFFPKGG